MNNNHVMVLDSVSPDRSHHIPRVPTFLQPSCTMQPTCLSILEGAVPSQTGAELTDLAAAVILRLIRGLKRALAVSAGEGDGDDGV